jgi:chromosome segregation protein
MPFEKGHHPGATWRKADLQCHSPRDCNWTDPPSLPGGSPEYENARAAWADAFMTECRSRGIQLVSITDHHDMGFVPYIMTASKADQFTLVLPGVEVTCNDNTQCLVFFDPSCPRATWVHFLGKLKGVHQAPVTDAKTAPTTNANMTIMELVEEVYGETFWRAHHEAWIESELNQREYCETYGIPLKAFGNWRAKFKAEPQLPDCRGLSHTLVIG